MMIQLRSTARSLLALAAGLSLMGLSATQAADHKLTDIKLDFGSLTFAMPEINVQGTELSDAELRDILSVVSARPIHERMARLSAASIIIPRLDISQKFGTFSGLSIHQGVRLEEVKEGRAARGQIASAKITGEMAPNETFTGERGPHRFEGLDLKVLAEAMTLTRPAGSKPVYQTVVASWQTEWSVSTQRDGAVSRGGLQTGRNLALSRGTSAQTARWNDFMLVLESLLSMEAAGKDPSLPDELKEPERLTRLFGMLDDFSLEEVEAKDLNVAAQPKRKDDPAFNITIKRAALKMPGVGASPSFALEDMEGTIDKARFALKSLSASGFSPTDGFEVLVGKLLPLIEDERIPEILSLLPTVGSLKFGGLSIEVPESGKGKKASEFTPFQTFSIDGFEMTTRAARNGIPTDLVFSLSGLTIPTDPREPKQKELIAMGFKQLSLGTAIDLGWNEAQREIVLRRLDFDMADAFKARLSGLIGQATVELFTPDVNVQQMAALGLTVKSAKAEISDLGLGEKFAVLIGKPKGQSPEEVKREWATLVALAIPATIGASDQAKAIATAVGRFIAKPGKLTIEGTARNKDGVGLADFMAAGGDAKALLPAFQVKAAAE